jgi:hypothetical protein
VCDSLQIYRPLLKETQAPLRTPQPQSEHAPPLCFPSLFPPPHSLVSWITLSSSVWISSCLCALGSCCTSSPIPPLPSPLCCRAMHGHYRPQSLDLTRESCRSNDKMTRIDMAVAIACISILLCSAYAAPPIIPKTQDSHVGIRSEVAPVVTFTLKHHIFRGVEPRVDSSRAVANLNCSRPQWISCNDEPDRHSSNLRPLILSARTTTRN